MTEESDEPDIKRAVSAIDILQDWLDKTQNEVAMSSATNFGKQPYPSMAVIHILLRSISMDLTDKIEDFEKEEKNLDKRYGGSCLDRNYEFSYAEASERLKNVMNLWEASGPGKIDKKSDYYQGFAPDSIDIDDWGKDE